MGMKTIYEQAKAAKQAGLKRFVSEKPCGKCGGIEFYSSSHGTCIACSKRKMAELRSTPEGMKKMSNYVMASRKKCIEKDPSLKDSLNESVRRWRATDNGALVSKKCQKKWRDENQLNLSLRQSLRRMSISMSGAFPGQNAEEICGYGQDEFIEKMLLTAPSLSSIVSGEYHVDHILSISWFVRSGMCDPKIVNALCNLQAIPKLDNLSKGNRWLLDGISEWEWCYKIQMEVYGEIRYKEGG